jgi:hypothetical protein
MASEATVGEVMAQTDEAVVEWPNPIVTVIMAEKPTSALALVVISSAQPTSSAAGHAFSSLHLEENVVLQFDATHCLSKLTVSWGRRAAGVAFFGEQLQVGVFFFLVFGILVCFTLFSYFLPFSTGEIFLSGSL